MISLTSALTASMPLLNAGTQPGFSSIRDDAATDARLRGHDLRVLLYLDRAGAGDRALKRSQQAIADGLGCARQTVWRSMRRLRTCGYLDRIARWGVQAGRVRRLVDSLTLVGRRHRKPRPLRVNIPRAKPPRQAPLPYVPPTVPEGFRGKSLKAETVSERAARLEARCVALGQIAHKRH